ncbi:MAG: plasmid recombination protein [Dehalococcoidia bacterium]|nr:plasmid recombination protein [Dehalococcoidia bacterium]
MHLCFTPITNDGRLSAKEIIGNRTQLTRWQDDFFEHMVKKFNNIERGESASVTKRQHIPTRIFKQAVNLTRQAEQIKATLNTINPLNAGKKRDEVISLLQRFFPSMESFETQLKKYKRTIDQLASENTILTKKAEAGEKVGAKRQLAEAKLRSDYDNLRQFVDSLPDEIKRQVQQQKSRDTEKSL